MQKAKTFNSSIILLILFLVLSNLQAQQKGKIILLHPKIGTALDWKECQRYGFFQDVKNLNSAVFYLMPDSTYQVHITYFKDDILRRKIIHLSPQTFLHDYYEVVQQKEEKRYAGKELSLLMKDGRSFRGIILSLHNDTLVLKSGLHDQYNILLKDIKQISILRHASVKTPLIISAVAGGVGATMGLMSGNDNKGWFSMTAGEKAVVGGIGLFSSSLFIGGSIAIVKAVDIEIPLQSMSLERRKIILNQVRTGKYKSFHGVRLSSSVDYLLADDDIKVPAFSLRLQVQHKPRILFSLSYTRSTWSKWHIIQQFSGQIKSLLDKEKYRFTFLSAEITALARATGLVIPFFRWGLAINYRDDKTYSWSRYTPPEPGVPQSFERTYTEKNSLLAIPFSLGMIFNLHPSLSLELEAKKIWTEKAPWQFGLGLQIGQSAFRGK